MAICYVLKVAFKLHLLHLFPFYQQPLISKEMSAAASTYSCIEQTKRIPCLSQDQPCFTGKMTAYHIRLIDLTYGIRIEICR